MSEMVERVAEAAYAKCMANSANLLPLPPDLEVLVNEPPWSELAEQFKVHWREIARAAIEAMRKPTEAMVEGAWMSATAEDAAGVWRDMIDKALK